MRPERNRPEFIDGLSVCVGYADMLAVTLPLNRKHCRRFVIVTSLEDSATQRIANEHNCEVVVCDRLRTGKIPRDYGEREPTFNKGAAINDGMNALRDDDTGWVLIHDSDIIFTDALMDEVRGRRLDSRFLYGAHRCDCRSHDELQMWKADPSVSSRWPVVKSWPGVGYFQLFHMAHPKLRLGRPGVFYEEGFGFAAVTDTRFMRRLGRPVPLRKRVIHLYHGSHKANWFGRSAGSVTW